jgi:hypothetical protein
MTFLSGLWVVAFLLAVISVAMMLLMIGRRVIRSRFKVRRDRQRHALLDDILAYLRTGEETRVRSILTRRRNVRVLPEILHQLLGVVNFEDTRPIYELLSSCGTLDRLIDDSSSVRIDRRILAVETLAEIEGPKVIPALDACIGDSVAEISVAALSGLARMNALPPFSEILKRLEIGIRHSERPYRQLFRSLAPDRTGELVALLAEERSPASRVLITDALGECDEDISCKVLAVLTRDPSEDVRASAMRSLVRIGRKSMDSVVLPRLADTAWMVRAQAVQACAGLGLQVAIPLVVELLNDHHWWVRYRAAQALAQLGGRGILALCNSTGRRKEAVHLVRAVLYELELAA